MIVFSPSAGKTQTNTVDNLAGTIWNTIPIPVPTLDPLDIAYATLTCYYNFDKEGKVRSTAVRIKSIGHKRVNRYNPFLKRLEIQIDLTPPDSSSESLNGTYIVFGDSIYLFFPTNIIRANIHSNSMEGILTHTSTGKKEKWTITRASRPKSSNGSNSSHHPSENRELKGAKFKTNPLLPRSESYITDQKQEQQISKNHATRGMLDGLSGESAKALQSIQSLASWRQKMENSIPKENPTKKETKGNKNSEFDLTLFGVRNLPLETLTLTGRWCSEKDTLFFNNDGTFALIKKRDNGKIAKLKGNFKKTENKLFLYYNSGIVETRLISDYKEFGLLIYYVNFDDVTYHQSHAF